MPKPTQKKRSRSEVAAERVVASEVILRATAINYALVAALDPSDPLWRRCWLELRCAAIGMVAAIQKAEESPERPPPSRALASRRSATPPTLRRLRRQAAL